MSGLSPLWVVVFQVTNYGVPYIRVMGYPLDSGTPLGVVVWSIHGRQHTAPSNAPWGARRRSAGNWATRLRFGPIKDYARAMAIAGLETWCYRQAFPGAANGQPQYVVVT